MLSLHEGKSAYEYYDFTIFQATFDRFEVAAVGNEFIVLEQIGLGSFPLPLVGSAGFASPAVWSIIIGCWQLVIRRYCDCSMICSGC